MKRKDFILKAGFGGVLLASGAFPVRAMADADLQKITILHTNDVHSRIEAFPLDGGRYAGLGGTARRSQLINMIRAQEEHVLLLDAGDIFQGTPYFNMFQGELEFKLMSAMGYEAATIGNHDFDRGIDGLLAQMPNADFPFVSSNYDFSNTIMDGYTKPYLIIEKGEIRIGILGLGIEMKGLVARDLYAETHYLDPIEKANETAGILRKDEKCDYVICLSHLGYSYRREKVSDRILAENSEYIDLIIGGHTHTFMEKAEIMKNVHGEAVMINQVGWAGIMLGRLDIHFERNKKGRCISCSNNWIQSG